MQSANATSSASDRASLDQEVQQRLAEIQRIAAHTSFNGLKLLDGSLGTDAFQVGANHDETIRVDLSPSMQISNIGAVASGTGTALVNTVLAPTGAGSGAVTDSVLWFGVEVYNGVFRPKREVDFFKRRFMGRYNPLTLIARMDDKPVGFWIGFELKPGMFYHWLGGVAPDLRRHGVGRQLQEAQQALDALRAGKVTGRSVLVPGENAGVASRTQPT